MRIMLIFLVFLVWESKAQDTYVVMNNGDLMRMEEDFSLSYITGFETFGGIVDIAVDRRGLVYGIGKNGIIYRYDLINGGAEMVRQFYTTESYTSLVCLNGTDLYSIDSKTRLHRYDIENNKVEIVDTLGHVTPGDLSTYRGHIIFQSWENKNIMAYDPQTKEIREMVCVPEDSPHVYKQFWGLCNHYTNCHTERIIGSTNINELYEFNFEENAFEKIHTFDTLMFPDERIYGMATSNEFRSSNCYSPLESISCEATVSNASVAENDQVFVYPNPFNEVVNIDSESPLVKTDIYSVSGQKVWEHRGAVQSIDTHALQSGMYIMKIETDEMTHVIKLIKE